MNTVALWTGIACCALACLLVALAGTIGARNSRDGQPHPNHQHPARKAHR